ncbi:hypothetical protein LTV02_15515 [Nocardia yamanashiensis]|uniref:hypothetical protein n=1 Tax=Nocardia yamanashiensis TaxID=209247 RepID=UPI001E2B9DDA|nr:hypothetical protein [Nocardia yamanashiensis]UGT44711.1 hypothetical protein LTV02_15515 [Nocardia yamanashiensis]
MRLPVALATALLLTAAVTGCGSGDDSTATSSASTPAALPQMKNCVSEPEIRPSQITITCADGNLSVSGLTWTDWTADAAHGRGIENSNTCEPSCADGRRDTTPAAVTLSKPVDGYFTQLTVMAEGMPQQAYPLPK